MSAIQSVQVFGRKKAATAVAYCKQGRGLIKVNGCPIELLEPEILRLKTFEPVLLLGQTRFANVDIRIRVKGGGFTAQIYAIRQAIAKIARRLLPEIRRRSLKNGDPRHPHAVRPHAAGRGPAPVRIQKVRRPVRARARAPKSYRRLWA